MPRSSEVEMGYPSYITGKRSKSNGTCFPHHTLLLPIDNFPVLWYCHLEVRLSEESALPLHYSQWLHKGILHTAHPLFDSSFAIARHKSTASFWEALAVPCIAVLTRPATTAKSVSLSSLVWSMEEERLRKAARSCSSREKQCQHFTSKPERGNAYRANLVHHLDGSRDISKSMRHA